MLVARSWGWDLSHGPISKHDPDQKWANWPVRLYKMGVSCLLFQQFDLFQSLQNLAKWVAMNHNSLEFHFSLLLPLDPSHKMISVVRQWEEKKKRLNA